MESHTFTAIFTGNPKPEIGWTHNERILHQTQTFQMRIRDDKAILTVVEVSPKEKGEYVCRAANVAGEDICRAKLEIKELTYEEKIKIDNERYAAVQIQEAAKQMKTKEIERREKQNQEQKLALQRLKEERKSKTSVQKFREIEDSKINIWKQQMKKKIVASDKDKAKELSEMTPEKYRVTRVYEGWKKPIEIEETYPLVNPEEFSPKQVPGVKALMKVVETSMKGEEIVKNIAPKYFEDKSTIQEIEKVCHLIKSGVQSDEIWPMFKAGEFKHIQQPKLQTALVKICEDVGHFRNVSLVLAEETQQISDIHPVGLESVLRMIKHAKTVKPDQFFQETVPLELGKFSSATQELQNVSKMLRQEVEVEEILSLCDTGKLPTLKKPETQQALVSMVDKLGHSIIITQVLVEESLKITEQDTQFFETAWQSLYDESFLTIDVSEIKIEQADDITVKTLSSKTAEISSETVATDSTEALSIDKIEQDRSKPTEEIGYETHKAISTEVKTGICVPGFKALIQTAKSNQTDLETLDIEPLKKAKFEKDIAKLSIDIKKGISVEELMTLISAGEYASLRPAEVQPDLLDVVDKLDHATVTSVLVKEAEEKRRESVGLKTILRTVESNKETIDQVIIDTAEELGPSTKPAKELATVGHLLNEGVTCNEIVTLLDSGYFPDLQKPEIQIPLLRTVLDKGYISTVCEVLTDESAEVFDRPKPRIEQARLYDIENKLKKATLETVIVKTFTKEMVPGTKAYLKAVTREDVEDVEKATIQKEMKEEMIKIIDLIKHGAVEEDIWQMIEAGEFPEIIKESNQANILDVVEDFGYTAVVNDVIVEQAIQMREKVVGVKSFIKMAQQENFNIERILNETLAEEFGPDHAESLREMAKVNIMLKEGILAEEIVSMIEAGRLPELSKSEIQAPLIKILKDKGYTAIICEVLIAESVKDIKEGSLQVDVASTTSEKRELEKARTSQTSTQVDSSDFQLVKSSFQIIQSSLITETAKQLM